MRQNTITILSNLILILFLGTAFYYGTLLSKLIVSGVLLMLIPALIMRYPKERSKTNHIDGIATFSSVIVTFYLQREFGLSPVVSSSLVGLLGFIFFKNHQIPIYAGSFTGMACSTLFSYKEILFSAILMGIFISKSKHLFVGVGGRLGLFAFLSTLITALIFIELPVISLTASLPNTQMIIVFGLFSGLLSYYLVHEKKLSTILTISMIGLFAGIILPTTITNGDIYTLIVFQNSFIATASSDIIKSRKQAFVASMIGSILFILLFPYYVGLGGKFGTKALLSIVLTYHIFDFFTDNNPKNSLNLELTNDPSNT